MKGRPDSCPLCGESLHETSATPARAVPEPDDYQAKVRDLREELKRLRESGAEAV